MSREPLSEEERRLLLQLARRSIEAAVNGKPLPEIRPEDYPARLFEPGVCFVTLTDAHGELRGCVGALEAYQPLVEDVREHAIAAALQDYRFPPVQPHELAEIEIEISRLTPPVLLEYSSPEELLRRLRPGVDGVVLSEGIRRATFLPQVWEKIPDPAEFLGHLCMKMGADGNYWRYKKLKVFTYQVEEFREPPHS